MLPISSLRLDFQVSRLVGVEGRWGRLTISAIYEGLALAAYCIPFAFYAVQSGNLGGWILAAFGFLVRLASVILKQYTWFYTTPVQILRAVYETAFLLGAIWWLEAWRSPIWLLLVFPVFHIARNGNITYTLSFLAAIAIIPPALIAITSAAKFDLDLMFLWMMQVGYLLVNGMGATLLVTDRPVIRHPRLWHKELMRAASGEPESFPWNDLAQECALDLRANHLRLFEFKALTGTVRRRGVSNPHNERTGYRGEDPVYLVESASSVLRNIRTAKAMKESYTVFSAAELRDSQEEWALPAVDSAETLVFIPVFDVSDTHFLGIIVAEYTGPLPTNNPTHSWEDAVNQVSNILTAIMDYLRESHSSSAILSLSNKVLKTENFRSLGAELAPKLAILYGVPCAIWEAIRLDASTDSMYLRGLESDTGANCRVQLDQSVLIPLSELDTNGTLLEGSNLMLSTDTMIPGLADPTGPTGPFRSIFIPVVAGGELRVVISLHVASSHDIAPDLGNIARAIRNYNLIMAISVFCLIRSLRDQQAGLTRAHTATAHILRQTPHSIAELAQALALYAKQATGFSTATWVRIRGAEVLWWNQATGEGSQSENQAQLREEIIRLVRETGSDPEAHPTLICLRPLSKDLTQVGSTVLVIHVRPRPDLSLCLILRDPNSIHDQSIETVAEVVQGYARVLLLAELWRMETVRYTDALESLDQFGKAILQGEDLNEMLAKASQAAMELTQADLGTVLVLHPGPDEFYLRLEACWVNEGRYADIEGKIIPINRGVTGRVAETGKAVLVDDVSKDSDYISSIRGMKSELAVPLWPPVSSRDDVTSRLRGVLNVESRAVSHFDKEHILILKKLAVLVAIALQQREQVDDLVATRNWLESAYELAEIGLYYGEDIHLHQNKLGAARQFAVDISGRHSDLDKIRNKAARIVTNIDQVLALMDKVRRSAASDPENFDVHEIVRTLIRDMESNTATELRATLRASDSLVYGFKKQTRQVIRVILFNAIQVMEGRDFINVLSWNETDNFTKFVVVEIRDTGLGIPVNERDTLFTLRGSKRTRRSFGMGLAWSYNFIRMIGGDLSYAPVVPEGTSMIVRIPKDFRRTAAPTLLEDKNDDNGRTVDATLG